MNSPLHCAGGNMHCLSANQDHSILPDGKLFLMNMTPNEKAMIKCDVHCIHNTFSGVRSWCKDFVQFCHDHAHCAHPSWCFRKDRGGEWGSACGNDVDDDLPSRMHLPCMRMAHAVCRVLSHSSMFPRRHEELLVLLPSAILRVAQSAIFLLPPGFLK